MDQSSTDPNSQKQILKSTGIIGGAQIFIILIGIVRTKALAILLGPVGVGIAGLYQSITSIISTSTSFGIGFSAVRDIAKAAGENNPTKIARVITVFRRWTLFTGLLGGTVALVFCRPLSRFTFGNTDHTTSIAILAVAILLANISAGQIALLQGLRRIGDMAKANVLGAIAGLATAVPIYWIFGQRGIVPAMLVMSSVTLFISWLFSRKVVTLPVRISLRTTVYEGRDMVRLGFFTVITAFVNIAVMYLVRAFIVKESNINAVGQFTAAWTISSMYISAIFTAMGADYYPRLSGVQHDQPKMNKMVNEQTEIALLVAAPVIIGMISFINLVVHIFYSQEFDTTASILSWQLAGDFFRVLAWPIGFVFLAKGKGKIYIFTNVSWDLMYFVFVVLGWRFAGLEATGFAFTLAYLISLVTTFAIAKTYFSFYWSAGIIKYMLVYLPLVFLAIINARSLDGLYEIGAGLVITLVAVLFSFRHLKKHFNFDKLLSRFKFKTS